MAKISKYDGLHVKVDSGRIVRCDKGAALPSNADEEHVVLLELRGMVEDGEPNAGIVASSGPVAFDVDADAAKSKSGRKSES
jgi:hypothetical protein